MSGSILSGITHQHYYAITPDLDLITTTPSKEAIDQYLAQIPYNEFPEFIVDVLTKVEGHSLGDITDGPGDEKQDIVTITPQEKKCLVQLKHKEDSSSKYSGDELDRLTVACMRKNCQVAIFVTNGDLSPQAKNYIHDKEYLRGWPGEPGSLQVDYWNGYRIWEKIKNNSDILHKWFSGMAQAHALVNFNFELHLLKLPFNKEKYIEHFEAVFTKLLQNPVFSKTDRAGEYKAELPEKIVVKIRKWIIIPEEMPIKLYTFQDDPEFWMQPLPAIAIEVQLPKSVGKYSPESVKENILRFLFSDLLVPSFNKEWWHLIASPSKSFLYLHNIGEPRQVMLDAPRTFVRTGNGMYAELSYSDLKGEDFKLVPNDNNEEAIFIHEETGIQIVQLFEQTLDPYAVYRHQRLQMGQLDQMRNYEFRAAENIDGSQAMRIRRILDPSWTAITQNHTSLIWGYPKEYPEKKAKLIHDKLKVLGIQVLTVREEDKRIILDSLSKDIPPVDEITVTELSNAALPIDLVRNGFWLYKEIPLKEQIDVDTAGKLLSYKFAHEREHGFDYLQGKETLHSHTTEMPALLFDFFTIRCDSMIDISILCNPLSFNMRIFPRSTEDSKIACMRCINEFEMHLKEIAEILKEYVKEA